MHAHGEKQTPARDGVPGRPNAVARPGGPAEDTLLSLQRTAGNAAVVRALAAVQRSAVHDVVRGGGRPLETGKRADMEARLGANFSGVRVHTDAAAQRSAAELGARAYTSGNHIVIGRGGGDDHTLAHELTHVIQQSAGPVAGTPTADGLSVSSPSDPHEKEAEAVATRAMAGLPHTRQVQRAPAVDIQRLAIGDSPTTWGSQPVRRSAAGRDGVFFVGPAGQEVVVKPLASTGNVEYAHEFLAQMGVSAPRTVRYSISSPEGQAISELLRTNTTGARTPTEVTEQLTQSQAFLVMEAVQGESLHRIGGDDAVQYLGDDAALRLTGRTMVVDAFLGNEDRAVPRVNLGNFIYQVATAIAPPQIHAVDNDSRFPAPNVGPTRAGGKAVDNALRGKVTYLDELRRPPGQNPLIAGFLNRLRAAHTGNPQVTAILDEPARLAAVKDLVGQGIKSAFADLTSVFTENSNLLRAVGANYDEASAENRNVSSAKAAAKYVKDTQGGMPQAQAMNQLIAYVEHRLRKDRLPASLKWTAKFTS